MQLKAKDELAKKKTLMTAYEACKWHVMLPILVCHLKNTMGFDICLGDLLDPLLTRHCSTVSLQHSACPVVERSREYGSPYRCVMSVY